MNRTKPLKPSKEALEAEYAKARSIYELAKLYECSPATVSLWMKAYGIKAAPTKGRKLSPEHREKVVKTLQCGANKGKKHSPETRAAMSEARRGENNANYKGGITKRVRALRDTPEYKAWRKAVLDRAAGRCDICGREAPLEAHHIVSVFKDFSKALDTENGMALCHECHKEADKKGKRNEAQRNEN